MQTLQFSSPIFTASHFEGYHGNNPIDNMKKSSKSVSKYIESSSMLYSPNNRFIDETFKNNLNTVNTKQDQSNLKSIPVYYQNQNKDETKKEQNPQLHKNQSEYMQNNLGKVVSRLQTRLQGAEVKIASLTTVVKLLQKYSQTKDDQYEKEKENMLFAKNVGQRVQQIENLEIQNKIKEFNAMSKQMKRQIQQVANLRHKLQANLSTSHRSNEAVTHTEIKKAALNANKSKKSQSKSPTSQGSYIDVQDLASAFEQMQQRLRDEINKKMQICLRQIKKIGSIQTNDITGIDQNLFEEQINSLNFSINKLENQCARNKMLLQNQVEELMSRLPIYHSASVDYLPKKFMKDPESNKIMAVRDRSGERSTKRSHSRKKSQERSLSREKRDKSKSNLKSYNNSEKLLDKKKLKEEQLQEAIRRKKEIKEKLKSANNSKRSS